jgi:HAE1 family hydrophobic/amphiphilic exporter-1
VAERYNLYRSATVRANTLPGISSSVGIESVARIAKAQLPDGYQLEWTGFTFQELSAGSLAAYAFALALVFVYLFLVAQYESWTTPIAIILLVPVAMLGAIGLLSLVGMPFNLYAQIGVVLLIGLAAKNAILIVEFARKLRESDGHDIETAARTAAHLRFRAVMMTVLCFVLGILPLVFASGAGMFSQKSVGLTVLGGMLSVLFIGLVYIPAFFVVVQRSRERWKSRLQG